MDANAWTRELRVDMDADPSDQLNKLFDVHYERLYRLARRLSLNKDEALDLVQETFLRAARAPASIPEETSGQAAWLVRVLVNIRRDQWRKSSDRARLDRERTDLSSTVSSGENAVIAKATVWRALNLLPPRRRAILILHELEGMDIPAIAGLLGISRVTIRWHLSRGRRELRRVLEGER